MNIKEIEIFETDNNKKGDLFSRLMGDLFHSLGYAKARFDIHKSGRELDIEVHHRTEQKIAIAECKAHKNTIGGADLNKFFGALETEKNRYKKECTNIEVIGYFISMSGFKETAIEQELANDNKRMILLDGEKIIKELVSGKILISTQRAISNIPKVDDIELFKDVDLIASDIGWIWVFYYGKNQNKTHFSLVHAEGNPLIKKLANKIRSIDKKLSNKFKGLSYIFPIEENNITSLSKNAKEKYFQYIESECGEIQFEGLPTDKDAGSVKVKLENIFEPLHIEEINKIRDEFAIDEIRESFGTVLTTNSRLAILAKPGGGKSTLIKRLAVAYAYPNKIKLVNDNLPKKRFFPIFIRCRELGKNISSSITDIIYNIPNKAEFSELKEGFQKIVSEALQDGKALLLIDGLDEISKDRDRISFVNQLRIFLSRYPNIGIVTTSRTAGFRAVAGILADYCTQYEISSLSNSEIRELSEKWHIAIIDNTQKTIRESNELVKQILEDGRITSLAENPLLLTTLLFVKRWAGYLPTKRHILYQEMIKLLLVTWNVEGHDQLDIDEAEPQLAYVAFWMTEKGKQTITEDELKKCLSNARKQMPDILGYTNIGVPDFIKRVESRSSLLIMSGHKQLEDSTITPIYEFLHLSFQEYLTAKAVVDKSLPNSMHNKTNLEILKPYILKENWKEVIPLVAILSKRDNKDLITYLINKSKLSAIKRNKKKQKNLGEDKYPALLLGNCIANEIQIKPDLLKKALEWYSKNRYVIRDNRITEIIVKGKFGVVLQNVLEDTFFDDYDDIYPSELTGLIGEVFLIKRDYINNSDILEEIKNEIYSNLKVNSCIGIAALMSYAFNSNTKIHELENYKEDEYYKLITCILKKFLELLKLNDNHYSFLISWTIAWIYNNDKMYDNIKVNDELVCELINIWLFNDEHNIKRMSAWALINIFNPNESVLNYINKINNIKDIILKKHNNNNNSSNSKNEYNKCITYYIGIEIGIKWDSNEIKTFFKKRRGNKRLFRMYAEKLDIKINLEKEELI